MTQIDRYILVLFVRTVLVCFLSLAGIFIVFHAFTSLDDLLAQADPADSVPWVVARFYGPYLLLLFDMTGAIITLMAFLFTAGWLRRTGELTATLSAGVSHGRLMRPMVIASLAIVTVQLANRELLIPKFRDSLDMKAKNLSGEIQQPVSPTFDQVAGVLIEGNALWMGSKEIEQPNFRLYSDFAGFGDLLLADRAVWSAAEINGFGQVRGYRLTGVSRPENVEQLPSQKANDRWVLMTAADQSWLSAGECFVVTDVPPNMLQTNETGTRLASVLELSRRVGNPAVDSSLSLQVYLHERIVRAPLDFALILMVLPLVVNRHGRKLFVLIGSALGLVLGFFALKTFAGTLGGNGLMVGPAIAAWLPLLVIGPLAYERLRRVQTV